MTANTGNPTTGSGPDEKNPEAGTSLTGQTQDWVDKLVSKTFVELFTDISSGTELHPSETFNKELFAPDYYNSKIYEIVNSYHVICKLCEQQFYCFSMADDINSFFQKHLNTSYHRQNRAINRPADDTPIFTWEEKFYSGRCNVCDMSDLNSYIIKAGTDIMKLIELHNCIWDRENRQTREEVLRRLTLLRKYCGLEIFQKKFLKKVQERDVCLLCRLRFPPSGKTAVSHLSSSVHYLNFCTLIQKVFNFEPKDVLNGYNLEAVTRWAITVDIPPVKEFTDHDEFKICLEQSNNNVNPYFEDDDNFSFSPKLSQIFLNNTDMDFIRNQECLLCNVEFKPGHGQTVIHKKKAANVGQHSFNILEKYLAYQNNLEKRAYIIKTIQNLKSGLLETSDTRATINSSLQENFFKALLREKIELVKDVFTMEECGKFFCRVCNVNVPSSYVRAHVNSSCHKYNAMGWNYLEANLGNSKLVQPFLKIKFMFVCLLCCEMMLPETFCVHLRLDRHVKEFKQYCSLDSSISISSVFVFHTNYSCYCTICNARLSRGGSFSSVKKTLRTIKSHWPCPVLKNKTNLVKNEEMAAKEGKVKGEQKNKASGERTFRRSSGKETQRCANKTVDFGKVGQVVENTVNVLENEIKNNVPGNAMSQISNSRNSRNTTEKKVNVETDRRLSDPPKPPSATSNATPAPTVKEKKETYTPTVKNNTKFTPTVKKKATPAPAVKESATPTPTVRENTTSISTAKENSTSVPTVKENSTSVPTVKENSTSVSTVKENSISTPTVKENSTSTPTLKKNPAPAITVNEKEVKKKDEDVKTKGTTQKTGYKKKKKKAVKDQEILIIDGLQNYKNKTLKELYSKFSQFGKVLFIKFIKSWKRPAEKKSAILAFEKPGLAEAVAKSSEIYLNQNKLHLRASTTFNEGLGSSPPLMNEVLVRFLENPEELMDFMLNLIMKATKTLESSVEIKREEEVCRTVISAVIGEFPQARCYPFGSRLSGLVLDNSDLDVFLDSGGMYDGFKNTSRNLERKLLDQVHRLLKCRKEITNFTVVKEARVPIISFLHRPTLMHCDLSFKNGLSIHNTLLIKFMISLDWRVKPLILFMKYWAKLNKLHGPPFFSSYAITMLVIFYLEQLQKPILPTIDSLQKSYLGPRTTIAGWNCSINASMAWKCDNQDTLPHLLMGLFEFCEKFDFLNYMVSPLTGQPVPKKAFSTSGFVNLPLAYQRQVLNLPTPIEKVFKGQDMLCIIDPFDVTHILTKNIISDRLNIFIKFCEVSAKYLKEGMCACQPSL